MPDDQPNENDRLLAETRKDIYGIRARTRILRNHRVAGYSELREDAWDERRADVRRAFNTMMAHPLVQKFKRNNVRIYMTYDPKFKIDLFKINIDPIKHAEGKRIEIPSEFAEMLDADELKAVIAHEIGHQLRADTHPRNTWCKKDWNPHASEICADKIGVLLSENPEALISGLEKVRQELQQKLDNYYTIKHGGDPAKIEVSKAVVRFIQKFEGWYTPYPAFEKRKAFIRETGERLKNEESKRALIAEIEHELTGRHKKLFSHHFRRSIPNFRDQPEGNSR